VLKVLVAAVEKPNLFTQRTWYRLFHSLFTRSDCFRCIEGIWTSRLAIIKRLAILTHHVHAFDRQKKLPPPFVVKLGWNWASINNRANMRSLLRTHGFMYNNNTPMNVIISRYKRNKKIS